MWWRPFVHRFIYIDIDVELGHIRFAAKSVVQAVENVDMFSIIYSKEKWKN